MKDKNGRVISRRSFLKTSATAAISFTVVPRHVLGGPK
ncbi:MAG: twin-arginine translocation signal domain-containing protein, partial [Planctomycetes bacterium]|nr:twin-arginine translocation signal domain-containing protein [Planctomycetota bacterium]